MKGMKKLKDAAKSATSKLPKPMRKKADKKLGLFIHKYIATLYYFDDEIQDIYWEMEEQAEKGNMDKVHELSSEMHYVIQIKTDEDYSGPDSRRHKKMADKVSKKMSEQADKIRDISDRSPKKLYDLAKKVVGKDDITQEEIKEEFDLENIEEEEN